MVERRTRARRVPEPESFLPLHPLEFRVLLVLLESPSHAYRIVKEIEAREPRPTVYPANLYRRIRDLLDKGLVEEQAPSREEASGRPRTVLRASELGRRVARLEAKRLETLLADARERRLLGRA